MVYLSSTINIFISIECRVSGQQCIERNISRGEEYEKHAISNFDKVSSVFVKIVPKFIQTTLGVNDFIYFSFIFFKDILATMLRDDLATRIRHAFGKTKCFEYYNLDVHNFKYTVIVICSIFPIGVSVYATALEITLDYWSMTRFVFV